MRPKYERRRFAFRRVLGTSVYALGLVVLASATSVSVQAAEAGSAPSSRASVVSAPPPDVADLARLQQVEGRIRRESLALLGLVRQMRPRRSTEEAMRSVEIAKATRSGCPLHEAPHADSRAIGSTGSGEEYEIRERQDDLLRVELSDGREGWLAESCLQVLTVERRQNAVSFDGVSSSELASFVAVAGEIYARIVSEKELADDAFEPYRAAAAAGASSLQGLAGIHARIATLHRYAHDVYYGVLGGGRGGGPEQMALLSRISAWAELLLGQSRFETEGTLAEEQSTTARSLAGEVALEIDDASELRVGFDNRREVLRTPYESTTAGAQYQTRRTDLDFSAGLEVHRYKDELAAQNDFGQTRLRSDLGYRLASGRRLSLSYGFLGNSYSNDSANDYSAHSIRGGVAIETGPRDRLYLELDTRLESSDSPFRSFRHLEPRVRYERRRGGSQLNLRGSYASLEYDDLELRSYRNLDLRLQHIASIAGRRLELGFVRKSFPENGVADYMQLDASYAKRGGASSSKHVALRLLTRLYSERDENDYSELRFDAGGRSRSGSRETMFNATSLYFRFWHDTGEGGAERSHVLDVNQKLGWVAGGLRFGPVVGLHALLSTEEGAEFVKRDGNLLRVGGNVEGDLKLGRNATLTLSAGYEYGVVYSDEFTVDASTGEIVVGDVNVRHPTTLQVNCHLRAPLRERLELIGRLQYYQIKMDTTAATSLTPVTANNRLALQIGVRLRKD